VRARQGMCTSLRPSLRLIFNAAGVQFTPLSILQNTRSRLNREHRRPSLRRIDRRTPLPDRGGRCRDRPLARLHRPDSRGPDRADALLRADSRRSRRTAAPVVDSRARTRFRGNVQDRSPHVLTRGAVAVRRSIDRLRYSAACVVGCMSLQPTMTPSTPAARNLFIVERFCTEPIASFARPLLHTRRPTPPMQRCRGPHPRVRLRPSC
jgi:hypothetical protein